MSSPWRVHRVRPLGGRRPVTDPGGAREYTRHVEVHLIPRVGHVRLGQLRASQVSAVLRDLATGGLGITSVRRVHATLRSALSDAVRADLVITNVARNAVVPRQTRTKPEPWRPEALGRFLEHVAPDPFGPCSN